MEEITATLPDFDVVRSLFLMRSDEVPKKERSEVQAQLFETIKSSKLLGLYKLFCEKTAHTIEPAVEKELTSYTEAELAKFDADITKTEENFGAVEVKNVLLTKADFCMRSGLKTEAVATLEVAYKKTVGSGMKIDNLLSRARLGFFFEDYALAKTSIESAEVELEKGGDWERKNRLLVYRAVLHLTRREFRPSAELFVKTLATFTSTELLSFKEFIFYSVITSMASLERSTVKAKVLYSPEVLSIIQEIPGLSDFITSLYESRYSDFFAAFVIVIAQIKRDRFLAPHLRYLTRTLRLVAFTQFLTSFKSVTIGTMATAFGVSTDLIDREISGFIAAGVLHCKIDRVAGVIESRARDDRNAVYAKVMRQGDVMLNKMQKLAKVIDM